VYLPVSGALIADTVTGGDLAAAGGLFGVLENLVVIVGPAIGGLLLLAGRPVWGIGLNLVTYALAAVLVSQMRVRSAAPAPDGQVHAIRQIVTGALALRRHPGPGMLAAFCVLGTAVYGASTVLYVPMSERFGTGADGYSYLLTAAAIGGVLGAVGAGKLGISVPRPAVIGISMGALALPFAATVLTTSPAVGFVLQVISGAGMAVIDVLAMASLRRDLPRDLLCRAIGIMEAAAIGAAMAASFAVADIIRWAGLSAALLIVGLGFSALALAGLWPLAAAGSRPSRPPQPRPALSLVTPQVAGQAS
jgi:hypothetical protein